MARERQITQGPVQKDLDDNINFSPDGRLIAFDCRGKEGINGNNRIGYVDLHASRTVVFYEQAPPVLGVGAVSFISNTEVVCIHALLSGLTYDFTVRGGRILPIAPGGPGRWLDSRDVLPPFTPGALRGGTHKHEPDASGQWIGFTYNDHITRARGSDLRNVGVSRRGHPVPTPDDPQGRNFSGESFSVLLTTCVDHPRPGTDDYGRAEGDCWVGREGYRDGSRRRRARAFRGAVVADENGKLVSYGEVFVVDIPDDITVPGPLGPLQGTETRYPAPPLGTRVRRLTRTAENPNRALRGVSGHLRASGDGRWIAFVGKAREGADTVDQVFAVSPETGEVRQLSHVRGGVVGSPRFSPDSSYVAAAGSDGTLTVWSARERDWGRETRLVAPAGPPPENLVISPNSRIIAYNRTLDGVKQIFVAERD